jgi:hypothetical protein
MIFMQIGCNLEILEKKSFFGKKFRLIFTHFYPNLEINYGLDRLFGGAGTALCRFGGAGTALYRPMSPKIIVKIGPFKLKNCQEPYFCMRNPKKLVPR